jgi:hypothetical protein
MSGFLINAGCQPTPIPMRDWTPMAGPVRWSAPGLLLKKVRGTHFRKNRCGQIGSGNASSNCACGQRKRNASSGIDLQATRKREPAWRYCLISIVEVAAQNPVLTAVQTGWYVMPVPAFLSTLTPSRRHRTAAPTSFPAFAESRRI